jgi:ribosomal protein S18 acetylase RimI-like enzyme
MKRMYIPERFQGQGTGRMLCEALIAAATADGYRLMRLDTGFRNTEAIAMYESLGFRMRDAYQDYPENLLEHLRFMERPLTPDADPG